MEKKEGSKKHNKDSQGNFDESKLKTKVHHDNYKIFLKKIE